MISVIWLCHAKCWYLLPTDLGRWVPDVGLVSVDVGGSTFCPTSGSHFFPLGTSKTPQVLALDGCSSFANADRMPLEAAVIFVTGSTGNVGSPVISCLRDRRARFRIGARKPDRIRPQDDCQVVPFDFLEPSTFRSAVRGCDAVFLLRPPAVSDMRTTLNPFLDVARDEGVRQVVFVSVAGAANNPLVPHHAVEQHLLRGPEGWTIVRPGFFAQNLGDAYRVDIVHDKRLFVPAGAGRAAFVDVRDVAEVAVDALTSPGSHRAQAYTLTGPEALSFSEAAEILSTELSQTILYHPASIPAYCSHLRRRGLPFRQVLVQTVIHVGLRFGQAQTVDPTLERLLRQRPRTLQEYVRDHRNLWI